LTPLQVLSDALQESVCGPLLFNVFINDLCNSIKHSRYFLFANDIKVFPTISSATDSTLPQTDADSNHSWCAANYMRLNTDNTPVITFIWKTNSINYNYKLCDKSLNSYWLLQRSKSSCGI